MVLEYCGIEKADELARKDYQLHILAQQTHLELQNLPSKAAYRTESNENKDNAGMMPLSCTKGRNTVKTVENENDWNKNDPFHRSQYNKKKSARH